MTAQCWDVRCTGHKDDAPVTRQPQCGDFVQRFDGNSNVHIADALILRQGALLVRVVCGNVWPIAILRHANGDQRRQCAGCRVGM